MCMGLGELSSLINAAKETANNLYQKAQDVFSVYGSAPTS